MLIVSITFIGAMSCGMCSGIIWGAQSNYIKTLGAYVHNEIFLFGIFTGIFTFACISLK